MTGTVKITSLAAIEAYEETPCEDRWRGNSTYDLIRKTAALHPERPAMKFQFSVAVAEEPLVYSYAELLRRIHQTANSLWAAGLAP